MASLFLLPDATELVLTNLEFDRPTNTTGASAKTCAPSANCPLCQQPSTLVHSYYVRRLSDLPCSGAMACPDSAISLSECGL
jgi:hypothetical protein